MNLGFKIKTLRESKNISREQMIDFLPISLNTYKKIEYGERIPTLEELKIISNVLEIDPSIFLRDDQTSIVNNGNFSSGQGNIIINEKELIFELTRSINKLSDTILSLYTAVNKKLDL